MSPPEVGFWGVTFHDRQVVSQDVQPGNAVTWVLNKVVAPILPGRQRYVTTGTSMRMHEAAEGRGLSGWDWLTHKIGPVQDVGDLDTIMDLTDVMHNGKEFGLAWAQVPENAAIRTAVLEATGKDLLPMLMESRNMEEAVYLQRYHLKQAQALTAMREFDRNAGFALKWTSKGISGAGNYLLTDPSFAPSLFIPFGGAQAAASRVGIHMAVKARRIGQAANRIGTSMVLHAPSAAPSIIKGGAATQAIAKGLVRLGESPAAMHTAMATVISHRGAVATEMAVLGGFAAHAHQAERIRHSEELTDIDAYQDYYRWDETGLGIALGAGLGYVFGGRAAHRIGARGIREAVTETAGGTAASPISHSFDNIGAQTLVDSLAVRGKRAAERLMGRDYDSASVYLLDDKLLREVGLDRLHMTRILEDLAEAAPEGLPPNAVHRVLADEITAAAKARRGTAIVDDVIGSQWEDEAFANALGRAARENPKAPEAKLFARARELAAEELQAVERRFAERVARATSRTSKTKVEFWRQEARGLIEVGKRRDLLRHEMEYLARVEARLTEAGDPSLVEGIVRTRALRYTDGTIAKQIGRRGQSKVGKALDQIRKETALLTELAAGPERTNALARLRRARKALVREAEKQAPVTPPQEVQQGIRDALAKAKLAVTPAQREKALGEVFDSLDANAATLMEDALETSKILKFIGLGGFIRKLARAGTGMEESYRSNLAAIRAITQEFDNAKLLVDDLDPLATTTHKSIQQLLEDMHAITSQFADEMRRLDQGGKFGRYVRNPREYNRKMMRFNRGVIKHITGTQVSDDVDVVAMAALWKRHADEIARIGNSAGLKLDAEKFFPRRWNADAINKNREGFRAALADLFHRKWQESDEVHLGTLEALGKAERAVDDFGVYLGHTIQVEGKDKLVRTLKRSDLEGLDVAEDDYLKALIAAPEGEFSPMAQSANRAMENLTGEGFEELKNGRIIRTSTRKGPQSDQTRALEEGVWGDDALDGFLDWRFMENVDKYMRTTGMRAMNLARHQKRMGIPGLTMEETIDFVDKRWTRLLQTQGASPTELKSFRTGIANLRQKLHLAEGRLPGMTDEVEGLREYLSELWVNTAGALYGQGIGSTIVSTELIQSTIGRIYGPTDLVKRVVQLGRAFKGAAGRPNPELRRQMVTLGLTQRAFRRHAQQRMLGQTTYNHGFQFRSSVKALEPWGDVWNMLVGKNNTFGVARRIGELPLSVTRAVAGNMMQLGGLDFFSTWSRLMHVQAAMDEAGHFLKAGKQMSALLASPANLAKLDDAQEAAIQAAIRAGKNEKTATRLGHRARFKVWKGIARKAGFSNIVGQGHWQVAEKWRRHGLLKPGVLDALEESGAFIDKPGFRTVDFDKLQRFVADNPTADARFSEALEGFKGLQTETIRKRVSEQSLLQTPTSQFARSPMGKVANSMTTWTRSFHDNNIMDSLQMPLRVGTSMMLAFTFGESLNMMMRELWNGKDVDDVIDDVRADPDNFIARAITSVPWLGQFGGLTRPAADALTRDDRMQRIDLGESASEGAATAMADILFDTLHAATTEEDVSGRTWRTASRLMPGYRTWAGLIANEGMEALTGIDFINEMSPTRTQRGRRRDVATEAADLPSTLDITLKPDLPEDVSFMFPETP